MDGTVCDQDPIDITFFVPCRNEEYNIIATLSNILDAARNFQYSYEILVFDDHSSDRSPKLIEEFRWEHPEAMIKLIINAFPVGLARNYVEAAIIGRGKYVKLVAGCNYEPRDAIIAILRKLGTADLVLLYYDNKRVFLRRAISKFYTVLVNVLSGYSLQHYHGVSLVPRDSILRWHPASGGYGFLAEFVTTALNEGATYVEVLVPWNVSKGHVSQALAWRNLLPVAHSLLNIFLNRIERNLRRNPIARASNLPVMREHQKASIVHIEVK